MANETNFWSQLGAGGYSALNEVLLGLPDFLARNVAGSENYKKLQEFRARNALGSSIGGTAGFIGSMLLPGGLLTKGLSKAARLGVKGAQAARLTSLATKLAKGAKAMDTATDVIKGTKLLGKGAFAQGAVRGAANALESAIPRALMAENADAGSVIQDVGLSALGAGALGGALTKGGAVIKGLKKKAGEGIREAATDQILRSRGIKPKDLVKAATFGAEPSEKSGRIIRSGIKQQAVDTIMNAGPGGKPIRTDEEMLTFSNREHKLWKQVASGWDDTVAKKVAKEATVFSNVENPTTLTEIGREAAQTGKLESFMDIVDTATNAKDFAFARKYLADIAKAGYRSADPDMIFKGRAATALREAIEDGAINNLASKGIKGMNLPKMKKDYKMVKMMEDLVARSESGMGPGISAGSDTAAKMLTSSLLGAGGLAAGGPVGAMAGLAIGNIANKGITSGANKLATAASEGIYKRAMGKMDDAVKKVVEAMGPGAEKLTEEMISKGATPEEMMTFAKSIGKGLKAPNFEDFVKNLGAKETGAAGELGKIIGRTGNVTEALTKDEVAAQTVVPETFEEEQAKASAQDTAQTPEEVEAGKPTTSEWIANNRNENYERLVLGNLKMVWYKTYMKKGVPFDEFVRSYYQSSNGFNPRYTASLIFTDKKKAAEFMSNFDKVEQLENLDWERLGKWSVTDAMMTPLEKWGWKDPEVTRRNTELARATKILTLLLRNQGVTEDKVINSVLPDVERILNSKLPVEEKKARIMQMTKDFGFNMDDYLDFGMGE